MNNATVILKSDAIQYGIGAVLLHRLHWELSTNPGMKMSATDFATPVLATAKLRSWSLSLSSHATKSSSNYLLKFPVPILR